MYKVLFEVINHLGIFSEFHFYGEANLNELINLIPPLKSPENL